MGDAGKWPAHSMAGEVRDAISEALAELEDASCAKPIILTLKQLEAQTPKPPSPSLSWKLGEHSAELACARSGVRCPGLHCAASVNRGSAKITIEPTDE
jgi:hypothetical protein